MKLRLFLLAALLLGGKLFAQDNIPYAEKAAQLQKEIWGTTVPEFKATTIPASMANESAVILARSYSSQRTSTGKIKFLIITAGITTRTMKLNTLHERVKINDKVALDNFSTLEYQKKLDKTVSLLITKYTKTHNTFIGAKIIKPDGKEVIVNTSEEVLIKNETKDQKGKLALPGLQVGDILDYYVSNIDVSEDMKGDSYKDNDDLFVLADEYPMLYYAIDFQFNKKVNVRYISANGAPRFTESKNEAGDQLFSLRFKNMPKYQTQLWTSSLRQYPYIEIGSSFTSSANQSEKKINQESSMLEGNKAVFESAFQEYQGFAEAESRLKDFFHSNKALKNAPLDSSMKVLYDEWKYLVFCNYQGDELENVGEMNYRTANNRFAAVTMCMILTDMEIDHDVLLTTSRNSNTLGNVFTMSDFTAAIRINGTPSLYMFFDDVVTHFNEIPARFQGERALTLHPKRHNALKYTFTDGETILPVAGPDKNRIEEQLQVSLLPASMQKLKIDRSVKQWGSLRHGDQKQLIPVQDVDNTYMEMIKGDPLPKRLSRVRETKKMADDYIFSFNKERNEMNKNFSAEIKEQFDQEPQQLSNYKITNLAMENTNPVFQYSASFVLDNMVKKAGNNYIIDAGKLAGTFYKLEDKDKDRKIDVYMPSARSFKYTINITIPPGYTAKGAEEMNTRKTNKTGLFASVAEVKGNVLTITLYRVYNNNFEKAADWPLLKELIDVASAFNDQKILLEKS